ncbi:hypothetical protein [Streptomyces decoyicus]
MISQAVIALPDHRDTSPMLAHNAPPPVIREMLAEASRGTEPVVG